MVEVVVTGMGVIAAPGAGLAQQQASLRDGRCHLDRIDGIGLPLASELPVAQVQDRLPGHLGRTTALGLVAGREALTEAGLTGADRATCATLVGTATGGMPESEATFLAHGADPIDPIYRRQPAHQVVTDIARELRLEGPQSTHSVACVSSACALGEALLWLRAGLVERALVVGTDALCRLTMAGFSSLKVIDAEGCRPFTEERAGMSLGEAGAALLLETGSAAARRGATAIARFAGWSISTDAQHPSTPDAEGTWLEQAIRESIADAGLGADGLSMVCAHGTGTRNNDEAEAKALARSLPGVPVASYKRIYGHCMGAAAALEAVLCCEMIRRQCRYPSAGVGLGQALGQVPVQQDFQEDVPVDAVLSTNAAFGGVNTALVFTRAD